VVPRERHQPQTATRHRSGSPEKAQQGAIGNEELPSLQTAHDLCELGGNINPSSATVKWVSPHHPDKASALSTPERLMWLQNRIYQLEARLSASQAENDDIKHLYEGLFDENANLEERCAAMLADREVFATKYNELLSKRFNAQIAGLWISQAKIKSAFTDLCQHVAAWCDDAAYQSVIVEGKNNRPEDFADMFGILSKSKVPISMKSLAALLEAQIFSGMVEDIFPPLDLASTEPHDLWASEEQAKWLATISQKLFAQGKPKLRARHGIALI
jgi:hypothetical protein